MGTQEQLEDAPAEHSRAVCDLSIPWARAGPGSGGAREREEPLWAGVRKAGKVKGRPLQEVDGRKRATRAAERR